jgi:hypothetical protein
MSCSACQVGPSVSYWFQLCIGLRMRGGLDATVHKVFRSEQRVFVCGWCRRVFNPKDIVCQVPRLMGYAHVGNAVEVSPNGTFQVTGVQWKPNRDQMPCSACTIGPSVSSCRIRTDDLRCMCRHTGLANELIKNMLGHSL